MTTYQFIEEIGKLLKSESFYVDTDMVVIDWETSKRYTVDHVHTKDGKVILQLKGLE